MTRKGPKRRINVLLEEETYETLYNLKLKTGKTMGELIDEAVQLLKEKYKGEK